MVRDKHPNKEIEEALQYLESKGNSAHSWGRVYCPTNDSPCISRERCITSVWSTPRSPANHANQLIRMVNRCLKVKEKQEEKDNE